MFRFLQIVRHAMLLTCSVIVIHLGAQAQSSLTGSLAGGASFGYSPSLKYEQYSGSGSLFSLFGDLVLNDKFIGRAQYTGLIANSFKGDYEDRLESAFAINGSLGYVVSIGSSGQFRIPVLATMGYAQLKYNSGNVFSDGSLQIGGSISPEYYVTDQLALIFSARYLKGTEAAEGSPIDVADLSVGIKYIFLE